MLYRLGFVMLLLGMMTADSDSLVVPFVAVLVSAVLILVAKVKEGEDETD